MEIPMPGKTIFILRQDPGAIASRQSDWKGTPVAIISPMGESSEVAFRKYPEDSYPWGPGP